MHVKSKPAECEIEEALLSLCNHYPDLFDALVEKCTQEELVDIFRKTLGEVVQAYKRYVTLLETDFGQFPTLCFELSLVDAKTVLLFQAALGNAKEAGHDLSAWDEADYLDLLEAVREETVRHETEKICTQIRLRKRQEYLDSLPKPKERVRLKAEEERLAESYAAKRDGLGPVSPFAPPLPREGRTTAPTAGRETGPVSAPQDDNVIPFRPAQKRGVRPAARKPLPGLIIVRTT